MYKIMIVEDEPPITRYLTRMITDHCPGFTVIDTADNGAEALKNINSARPDVILTDVKMPVMDGIALVKILKSEYPEIYSVIVSGYQDFEYAREALQSGVVDYLLKPVAPEQLKDLLHNLTARLDNDYHCTAVKLLAGIIAHLPVDDQWIDRYLNYRSFATLLIRKGALPTLLPNKPLDMDELCFFSNWNAAELEKLLAVEKVWLIAGRDESEMLVVVGTNQADKFEPGKAAETLFRPDNGRGFHTIVFSATPFELKKLAEKAGRLFDTVNQLIVIGKNQILDDTALSCLPVQEPPILDSSLENKLEFLINSRLLKQLQNELANLFQVWETQKRTQIWVEKIVRQILSMVEKHTANLSADTSLNLEKQLKEAFLSALDFDGLFKYVWDMIAEMLSPSYTDCADKKNAAANLLERVATYVNKNFAEPLTLQGVCETMGVSQPYLSRLFRKYKEMSFSEYINSIRINEAKRLMAEDPDMFLKDVAAIVGYQDPYYFSRIFKTVTGLAPSDYKSA